MTEVTSARRGARPWWGATVVLLCIAVTVIDLRMRLFVRDLEQIETSLTASLTTLDTAVAEARAAGVTEPALEAAYADPAVAPSDAALQPVVQALEQAHMWADVCVIAEAECAAWGGSVATPLRRWRRACEVVCDEVPATP